MNYIGISAGFHDAAVSVVNQAGDILFAAHSERYSKQKHDKDLCDALLVDALKHTDSASLEFHYYERPWIKAMRQLRSGEGFQWPSWDRLLGSSYNIMGRPKIHTHGHHLCHAAGGFQTSSFNDATVVVIDAIGALSPRAEAEKAVGEKTIGGQASLIAKFCRKIVPLLAIKNCALLVINHQFTDIMTGALKSSGGAKLEYHKSLSLSLKRKYGATAKRASDGKIFEVVVEAEVRKNKLAGTLGTKIDLFMEPGSGFLVEGDLFQEVLDKGIISRIKNSYFYADEKLGTQKAAKEWVRSHADELKNALQTTTGV